MLSMQEVCDCVATRYLMYQKYFCLELQKSHMSWEKNNSVTIPHHFKRDEYRKNVKIDMKRQEEYYFNMK